MRRFVIVATLAVSAAAFGCGDDDVVPMPSQLIGTWTTDDAAYADRFFELTTDRITIGTGVGAKQAYTVTRVLREDTEEGLLYTIDYTDAEGQEASMGFYFEAADGGVVRMQNQPRIGWKKSEQ